MSINRGILNLFIGLHLHNISGVMGRNSDRSDIRREERKWRSGDIEYFKRFKKEGSGKNSNWRRTQGFI